MPKNILIFSDGTGQAGGLAPDQRLSNIYKLYRATRVSPENTIAPQDQVAFYDPGLGTGNDEGSVPIKSVRFMRKFASAAIGFGISRNITDCYEAILRHYETGDRIFLFGFSRGAYTARCVGGVLSHCGVPTRAADGNPLPRYGPALRAIADEAVQDVYEHGAGKKRDQYEPERQEKARRFRTKYGSDMEGGANVVPYFIGVFDTVAALGASGFKRLLMIALLVAIGAATCAALAKATSLFLDVNFLWTFAAMCVIAFVAAAAPLLRSSFKRIADYPVKGESRWHFAGWKSGFYDLNLNPRVPYARHAIAIDETRKDFGRVPWAWKGQKVEKAPGDPEWLRQVWFAGCHSDIGGSYVEEESRLSDVALKWMVEQAEELPFPILVDGSKLHLYPDSQGMQHCEVQAMLQRYPRWFPSFLRKTWSVAPRIEARGAPLHTSVLDRFKYTHVSHMGEMKPYRPKTLEDDESVKRVLSELP